MASLVYIYIKTGGKEQELNLMNNFIESKLQLYT